MRAVFKKDLASLFHGMTGWLFVAVMWGLMSLYIGMNCLIGLNPDISSVLSVSSILMMVLLPVLCMRSFSEEQKTKTDQLLLTSPVSVGEIVLGKYLALALVHTIVVLGLCLYPILLSRYGTVPLAQSYTGLLGMWLFGLAELAVCVFLSSLTESVIIAAVLSFVCLFLSMIMPNLENMISENGNAVTKVLSALDIPSRFDTFLNGTLDLTSFVYLGSVIFLFLFLTAQRIQKRRYCISVKTLSFGAYSTGLIALVLAVTVTANLAICQLPSAYTKKDVTEGGLYSLTADTKEYLGSLDQDVTIYVLASDSDKDSAVDSTLRQMEELSSHLTVEYVDPSENPSFLQQYDGVMSSSWNSLVVESGSRYKVVNYTDLYDYTIDYSTYQQKVTGYDAEGQVDSAIAYVTSDRLPKVYYLTGHGEEGIGSNFTAVLSKQNCDYEALDLLQNDTVPEDCALLVINGPTTDLSSDDADKVLAFLEQGGDLVATVNFQEAEEMPNWDRVLAFYGVSASQGVVLENDPGSYYRSETYLLPQVAETEETSQVTSGNGYVFMAYSKALLVSQDKPENVTVTNLLTTSDNAYIHTDVTAKTEDFSKKDTDATGQYVLGLKAVVTTEDDTEAAADGSDSSAADGSAETKADTAESDPGADESATAADAAEDASDADAMTDGTEGESPDEEASNEDAAETDGEETSMQEGSVAYIFGSVLTLSDGADQMVSGSNSALFAGMVSACISEDGDSKQISVPAKNVSSTSLTVPTMTAVTLNILCIIVIPLLLLLTGFVLWLIRRRR